MNNQQAINFLKDLEKSLDDYCELNNEGKTAFGMAITALELFGSSEQLPSIQPERKIGQWIPSDSELEIKCNKCGKDFSEYVYSIDYIDLAEYPKFCPNCGVKMEEGG